MLRDITSLKRAEQRIHRMAYHDALTGLANREGINQQLDQFLSDASNRFGLILLDLDHFKSINDCYGHDVGDELLCFISRKLQTPMRNGDLAGRLGGDEFVVIIESAATPSELSVWCNEWFRLLSEPFIYGDLNMVVQCSAGGCLHPLHGTSRAALLKSADSAMYNAKRDGRGKYRIAEHSLLLHLVFDFILHYSAGKEEDMLNY